jgi:hypothetical protein
MLMFDDAAVLIQRGGQQPADVATFLVDCAAEDMPVPAEVARVLTHARAAGCDYVLFDVTALPPQPCPPGTSKNVRLGFCDRGLWPSVQSKPATAPR